MPICSNNFGPIVVNNTPANQVVLSDCARGSTSGGRPGKNGTSGTSGTSGVNGAAGTSGTNGTSGISQAGFSQIFNATTDWSGPISIYGGTFYYITFLHGLNSFIMVEELWNTEGSDPVKTDVEIVEQTDSNNLTIYVPSVPDGRFAGRIVINGTGSGTSGHSGSSGTSGTSATGSAGSAGTSGSSGTSATSGTSGVGTNGTSGTSGATGSSGASGTSGTSGAAGTSGVSGTSGTSGTSSPGSGILTGQSVQSGTGIALSFNIAHGLGSAPGSLMVQAGSVDAASIYYITADATNITVYYAVAPPLGTNNLTLNWLVNL